MNFKNDIVINLLKKYDEQIYLVGGAVRDFLLGKETFDKDILVNSAEEFANKFANDNGATFIELDKANKIYRVVLKDKINYLDITEPINSSLEDDLNRRDFTINAIAMDIKTEKLIDLHNGQQHLKDRIIKSICPKNIIDDPLRILRGYRFSATLGFDIEEETLEHINANLNLITKPAVERITYEMMKLFSGEYTATTLKKMDKIIDLIYPIFLEVKKVPPNTHHHLDLFNHSIETVHQIQKLYNESDTETKSHLDKTDFGGFSRLAHLKLAGFFHDIGKFSTWTIEEDRHRFMKHESVGSNLAIEILRKNKFSKKQINYITEMIKNHIYPSQVISAENVSEKNYMRFIRKMGDNVIDNIILAKADRLSARGIAVSKEMVETNINNLNKMLDYYLKIKPELKPLPKLLSGAEIMKIKGLNQSPILGEIINHLKEEQLAGNISTKEEAIDYIKNYLL